MRALGPNRNWRVAAVAVIMTALSSGGALGGSAVDANDGVAAIERGDTVAAISILTDVLRADGDRLTARERGIVYFNRGYAAYLQGDLSGAIADYDRAVVLSPDDYLALFNRGIVYEDLADRARAIDDYSAAIAIHSGDPRIFFNRGNLHFDMGELGAASEDYSRAIELDGEYADAYVNRGLALKAFGDYGRALADFDQALRLARHDPVFVAEIAVLIETTRMHEASDFADAAASLTPFDLFEWETTETEDSDQVTDLVIGTMADWGMADWGMAYPMQHILVGALAVDSAECGDARMALAGGPRTPLRDGYMQASFDCRGLVE